MRPFALLISIGIVCAWGADGVAQERLTRSSSSLRTARDAVNVEQPGPDVRFRATKSAEENSDAQQVISQKLLDAQEALKALDRRRNLAVAAGVGIPSARDDVERQKLLEMKASWLRKAAKFNLEAVCGRLDGSLDVELYQGEQPSPTFVQQAQPATGLIRWKANLDRILLPQGIDPGEVEGMRWCTGTLISEKFLLTAGHCFDPNLNNIMTPARVVDGNVIPLNPAEMAPLMQVEFNFQRDASKCTNRAQPLTCQVRRADVYPVVRLLEHRRNNLDYAIVELGAGQGGLPGARYSVLKPDFSDATLAAIDLLTIIQHPRGSPKRIAAGIQLRVGPNSIFYSDVDTMGGSSGAAVLDRNGRIVGVHTTGGCDDPTRNFENSGVTLHAISQVSDLIKP